MIAIIYFDRSYYKWADIYLRSLRMVEPAIKVVIYGYNLTKAQYRSLKPEMNNNILEVIHIIEKWDKKKASAWRYQLTCSKGKLLLDVMKRYPKEKLFMLSDVDLLFRRDLTLPIELMNYYDIGFVMGKTKSIDPQRRQLKAMGGLIFTKNNAITRKYFKEYHQLLTYGRAIKNKDQMTLAHLFKKYSGQTNCRFYLIDPAHYLSSVDWKYAHIWSPHKSKFGDKNERFSKFKNEFKRLVIGGKAVETSTEKSREHKKTKRGGDWSRRREARTKNLKKS